MTDPAPTCLIHATAVAIDGTALLIRGPSGAGKSDLALRLIDGGATLIADDQTRLIRAGPLLRATAPENIAGLLEVRGLGLVRLPYARDCVVRLLCDLAPWPEIERLPDPAFVELLGMPVPRLSFDPFAAATPAKLRLAMRQSGDDKLCP